MANSMLIQSMLRLFPTKTCLQPCRTTTTKHFNPKFKKLRAQKVFKVDLPDFTKTADEMTQAEIRKKLTELGLRPRRPWNEKPITITATGGIFEPYVPPEGDGKASIVSLTRAKQATVLLEKKTKTMSAIRKIKSFEEDFSKAKFLEEAQEIYIKAHECLADNKWDKIRDYVTEKAHPEFKHNSLRKTIRWKFVESLEPPRIVHARCTDVINKQNLFGQITVRFHSRQILCVYDRFGRLLHGSEILAKDVLEYIVFEKHISNTYGVWRIHDKIIPEWMPPKEPSRVTRVVSDPEPEPVKTEESLEKQDESKAKN